MSSVGRYVKWFFLFVHRLSRSMGPLMRQVSRGNKTSFYVTFTPFWAFECRIRCSTDVTSLLLGHQHYKCVLNHLTRILFLIVINRYSKFFAYQGDWPWLAPPGFPKAYLRISQLCRLGSSLPLMLLQIAFAPKSWGFTSCARLADKKVFKQRDWLFGCVNPLATSDNFTPSR